MSNEQPRKIPTNGIIRQGEQWYMQCGRDLVPIRVIETEKPRREREVKPARQM